MSGNQALGINNVVEPQANLAITTHGSDWYFAVCAVMGVSTLVFMGLALRRPQSHRLFHYITAGITAIACIAYFSMGSGLGQVPIQAEFVRPNSSKVFAAGTREVFYARYIDWFITTPLLLLDLLLTAGLPTPTILITIFADEVMIVTGLLGALTQTSYKWGFWTFGMVSFFYVIYNLLGTGRSHASALGGDARKTYMLCGVFLSGLWFLYPIAWGLSEGGNVIHPDSEAIFYGILDILAKPVYGALLIWGHRNINPADLGLRIRDAQHTGEKYHNGAHNGVHGPDRVVGSNGTHSNGVGAATPAV
ncbi:FDD123-like protein 2 [Seiridium cupressi]